jgi:hypothetical protein
LTQIKAPLPRKREVATEDEGMACTLITIAAQDGDWVVRLGGQPRARFAEPPDAVTFARKLAERIRAGGGLARVFVQLSAEP